MSKTPAMDGIDERARQILKALIEHYIAQGQPVGSHTLVKTNALNVSSATIRSVMVDLENMGLIASPHPSAGRIPTPKGYRFFVDTMLTTAMINVREQDISASLRAPQKPQTTIASAAQILSDLSQYVGVVVAPKRSSMFKQIEFVALAPKRILVIIVAPDGDVQNRVIHTEIDYTASQLAEASNYLTSHCAGMDMHTVRQNLHKEIEHLRSEISQLMQAAVNIGNNNQTEASEAVVIAGETKLLAVQDLATDLSRLRRAFDLFEKKTQLLSILKNSNQAEGIRIFIGGESSVVPNTELSVVAAPYQIDNHIVGTLAVIGPTRMPYNKMVHIVDITSKLLGNALSNDLH